MSISPINAAHLYASARPATEPSAKDNPSQTFASAMVETLKHGEDTAKAALTGNADMPALVEAMARTELAVETAVTIRDKVVEAYQEILRMPV